jgi:DNA-binding NtrC family response regulator
LRERPEDIPYLVDHFLRQFSRKYRRRIYRLTQEAIALLQSYLWPGNIRELRNVLERVFVETQAEVIGARAFREWIRERRDFAPSRDGEGGYAPMALPYPLDRPSGTENAKVEESVLEAELCTPPDKGGRSTRPVHLAAGQIRRAYRDAGGNMAEAARRLGVHRATLYRYLQRLGLSRSDL